MKISTLLLFTIFCTQAIGQPLTSEPMPSGYTLSQLRYRNDLTIDLNNNYWVAFDRIGLGKYDGTSWTMYDSLSLSLPANKVNSVAVDQLNHIFAGTSAGLSVYDGLGWVHYNNSNSLLPTSGVTVVEISSTNVWVGTNTVMRKIKILA